MKRFIQHIVAVLIFDWNWTWLKFIISGLCEIEMEIPLIFDRTLRDTVEYADIIRTYPEVERESQAQILIPKNTFYCEDCPFKSHSRLAMLFYGYQSCGYCYYLGKGDFSFSRPTMILWDGCKECGINDYEGEEDGK